MEGAGGPKWGAGGGVFGLRGHGETGRYGSVFAQLSPRLLKRKEMVRLVERGVSIIRHSKSDLNP